MISELAAPGPFSAANPLRGLPVRRRRRIGSIANWPPPGNAGLARPAAASSIGCQRPRTFRSHASERRRATSVRTGDRVERAPCRPARGSMRGAMVDAAADVPHDYLMACVRLPRRATSATPVQIATRRAIAPRLSLATSLPAIRIAASTMSTVRWAVARRRRTWRRRGPRWRRSTDASFDVGPGLCSLWSARTARVGHRSTGHAEPRQHPDLQGDPQGQNPKSSQHRVTPRLCGSAGRRGPSTAPTS